MFFLAACGGSSEVGESPILQIQAAAARATIPPEVVATPEAVATATDAPTLIPTDFSTLTPTETVTPGPTTTARAAPVIGEMGGVPSGYVPMRRPELPFRFAYKGGWSANNRNGAFLVGPGVAGPGRYLQPLLGIFPMNAPYSDAVELLDEAMLDEHGGVMAGYNAVRLSPIATAELDGQVVARAYYQISYSDESTLALAGIIQKGPSSYLIVAFVTNPEIYLEPMTLIMDSVALDLSGSNEADSTVDWSPDGRQIAFSSGRNGGQQLFLMDADGGNLVQLTYSESSHSAQADWSPDGQRIAYTIFESGQSSLAILDLTTGQSNRPLVEPGVYQNYPDWSPDGRILLFTRYENTNVDTIDPDGTLWLLELDTPGGPTARSLNVGGYGGVWSPDGSQIVFISNRHGTPDLYLTDSNGSKVTRLTNDNAFELYPAWSPNGQQIAFSRSHSGANLEIAVMDKDGANLRRLTDTPANEYAPAWSPDGRFIAFDSNQSGELLLYLIPAEGGPASLLSPPFP